jgi:hypothetical protein
MSADRSVLVGQDASGVARVLLTDPSGRLLISDQSGNYCRVYNSAAISVANATHQALTFDAERVDLAGMHSITTNPSRITALAAGLYLIGGSLQFANHATGIRQISLRLNGVTFIASHKSQALAGGVDHALTLSTLYELAVNDYIELMAYQTSGGALNVNAAGNYSPEFWALRV